MRRPRVLHLIRSFDIGGAQRTVSTLLKTASLESRFERMDDTPPCDVVWAEIVIAHVWRENRASPRIELPVWLESNGDYRLIIFNHDWEGHCDSSADLVLVYSKLAKDNWVGPQRIKILPGGITLDRFIAVAKDRAWDRVSSVGRLSTLNPGKISSQTISYWSQIKAERFLIGGDGSQASSLQRANTDEAIEFKGVIQPAKTHELLSEIDIFLYETDWHIESFCYAVLEAMAAGCVVVASRRGAIPELISDGKTGFLFDSVPEALSICNQILSDPVKARSVSLAASAFAEKFPSEVMRESFSNLILTILRGI